MAPSSGASDSVYHARADGPAAGGSMAGGAWLQYGPLSGSYDLTAADAIWSGDAADDWLGEDVVAIPDSNGDGFDEVA